LRLTVEGVLAFRLRRQGLDVPATDALGVVRRLCGVQAQVPAAAEAAVAIRLADPSPGLLDRLLGDGRAVRAWAMRGTLHVLAADQAPSCLALMAATRSWERPTWQRSFLTAAQLQSLRAIVAEALADGPRTREELVAAVEAASRDAALVEQVRSGWGVVLKPLAWLGELCHAPATGARVRFARPESLVPGWPGLPPVEQAGATVLRAFLAAHGPATETDVLGWLSRGATRSSDLRRWVRVLGREIVWVDVDGAAAMALAADIDELAATRPTRLVRLLPAFDAFVLGAGTGNPWIIAEARRPAVSRAGGWISPVVLAGGRVAGTWADEPGGVVVRLFAELANRVPRDVLEDEAQRRAAWAGTAGGLRIEVD
jgi:hypothetical protein